MLRAPVSFEASGLDVSTRIEVDREVSVGGATIRFSQRNAERAIVLRGHATHEPHRPTIGFERDECVVIAFRTHGHPSDSLSLALVRMDPSPSVS